jgi:hypothetical protein
MGDSITFKIKTVTIKKPRQCLSCYRKFELNSKMIYWVGLTEGDFGTLYMCPACYDIYNFSLKDVDIDDYPPFESNFIELRDFKEQTPEQLLEKLKQNNGK